MLAFCVWPKGRLSWNHAAPVLAQSCWLSAPACSLPLNEANERSLPAVENGEKPDPSAETPCVPLQPVTSWPLKAASALMTPPPQLEIVVQPQFRPSEVE